jgi:hypothetical protein
MFHPILLLFKFGVTCKLYHMYPRLHNSHASIKPFKWCVLLFSSDCCIFKKYITKFNLGHIFWIRRPIQLTNSFIYYTTTWLLNQLPRLLDPQQPWSVYVINSKPLIFKESILSINLKTAIRWLHFFPKRLQIP